MSTPISSSSINLRILATSDLHANLMDFDYYSLKSTNKFGLTRTATLIKKARQESLNTLLVDNGDLIQGSPLGCLYASQNLADDEIHPIIETLNFLKYDVATLGNHEFNYGLDFLKRVINDANFPFINANILDCHTDAPFFIPYIIKPTSLIDTKGDSVTLNIGFIGFVAPQIMLWDKQHLENIVYTEDIVICANKWVPKMKEEGADIIIALNHSGINADGYKEGMENATYYLTKIAGIDVVITGHSHQVFPGDTYADLPNCDLKNGIINNKPVTMAGFFGSHLGVIDLVINNQSGHWQVIQQKADTRAIYDCFNKVPAIEVDAILKQRLEEVHKKTVAFVSRQIGYCNLDLYGYLSLIQDSEAIQLINEAQKDFIQDYLKANIELEQLPVLSAASPFKAGGKEAYALSYSVIDKGKLTYRNAADLYPFPNTVTVVKVNGNDLKDWLEYSAGMFQHINVNSSEPQYLINFDGFKSYNFDIIDGVSYMIDVTEPPKFDGEGKLINPNASKIKNLCYQDKAVTKEDWFYIVTNNYRGYSGKVKGTGSQHVVINLPNENRSIIIDYISKKTKDLGSIDIVVDFNWQLISSKLTENLDIRFVSPLLPKAQDYIKKHAQMHLDYLHPISDDLCEYRVHIPTKVTSNNY